MILNDLQIRTRCEWDASPMISPFQPEQIRRTESGAPAISSGLSSFGYDLTLAVDGFRIFSPIVSEEIDPKNFNEDSLFGSSLRTSTDGSLYWLLPPHSYALGVTVETFNIPRNVIGFCMGKSTYARCGLIVNMTPLEPGWRGRLVLEFSNGTDLPIRVYANEGIAQVVFFEGDQPSITYADRAGKYQDQRGIVTARI